MRHDERAHTEVLWLNVLRSRISLVGVEGTGINLVLVPFVASRENVCQLVACSHCGSLSIKTSMKMMCILT